MREVAVFARLRGPQDLQDGKQHRNRTRGIGSSSATSPIATQTQKWRNRRPPSTQPMRK
ncbi:unnamed protein product [Ectocarpus sp. 12 AP-2014]